MADSSAEPHFIVALAKEADTARLAEDAAAMLRSGDLVALSGGLGAGKTTFARALIRALSQNPMAEVPSPTFALRIDHALPRLKIVHADLYRLRAAEELEEIGLDDALGEAALVVEWPELLPSGFAENRLDIKLEIDGDGRRAEIRGLGDWPQRLARTRAIRAFLDTSEWMVARRRPLVGDASVRAYERILPRSPFEGKSAILMNAPARREGPRIYDGRSYDTVAHRGLDVRPFVAIDLALQSAGVRVPKILASDVPAGLLLLQDLGSEGILDAAGAPIMSRYEAAIDVLIFIHGRTWPDAAPLPDGSVHRMPPYDRDALLIELSLFPDWFRDSPEFSKDEREDFLAAWSRTLERVEGGSKTWVLRDFHSPNILWQEHAEGIGRVGVIDFQDALIGDSAYDVASLAQDARAPISPEQEAALKARYFAGRRRQDENFNLSRFEAAYAVYAAQRATKVLGAFTRLAIVEGKLGYQRHRERLKALLRRTLSDPVLSDLRVWYERRL